MNVNTFTLFVTLLILSLSTSFAQIKDPTAVNTPSPVSGLYPISNGGQQPGQNPFSCGKDSYEPNDFGQMASPLQGANFYNASICPMGDEDWYTVEVESNQSRTTIKLENLPANYELELYADMGNFLIASSYNTGTQAELIQLMNLPIGTYYIRVFGSQLGAGSPLPYSIIASVVNTVSQGGLNGKNPTTHISTQNFNLKKGINPQANFEVYPNPTKGVIKITTPDDNTYLLEVLDSRGQSLLRDELLNATEHKIDLGGLGSGIFYLRVKNNEYYFSKKITVL